MLNVYTFHGTLVSQTDKRVSQKVKHHQEASTLSQAWDLAEKYLTEKYPGMVYCLSVGNRQPLALRPGYKQG